MLYSREKWCHSSRQSYQTVPDIMSLFHKNRTKGLKMRAIKAQTDAGNITQAEDSENWTDESGQEPPLFPLQRWHSWLLQILLLLVSPNENKDKMHLLMTLWTSSMTASLLQKLNHFYTRWAWSMWEVTLWQKNKSSQGLIHTVNLNCSKHMCMCVCVCMCTNWENECHQPFYSRQKLDSFPISKSK